jgi:hypothetical protein
MTRCLTLFALLTLSLFASAETFRLSNGRILNGTIRQGGGGSVKIETADGVVTYKIIEFDAATQARLAQYDTPPAAAPATPVTPAPPPVIVQKPPRSTSKIEMEEAEAEETDATPVTRRAKSIEDFTARAAQLKGPSRIVLFAGLGLSIIGGLWFIVRAFQESILWGLGVILCQIASLIFLIAHWSRAKDPFFLQLAGIAVMLFAIVIMG